MAELLVTELVVDASEALVGATVFEGASDRIVAASARAATAADTVSTALTGHAAASSTAASAAAASTSALSSQEAAMNRQSLAVGGSVGALAQLATVSRDVEAQQARVTQAIAAGAISYEAGQAELARLAERHAQVAEATKLLSTNQAQLNDVIVLYPGFIRAAGTEAAQYAAQHARATAALNEFRVGQASVADLVKAYPSIVAPVAGALATQAENYKALETELEKFRAGHVTSAALLQQFPPLLTLTAGGVRNLGAAHSAAADEAHHSNVEHQGLHLTVREGTEAYRSITDVIEGKFVPSLQSSTVLIGLLAAGHQLLTVALNPVVLGVGALGVILASVAERLQETASFMRQFEVGAQVMGTASLASAADLQEMFEKLRDTGIGATQAKAAMDTLRLNPIINPQAIPTLVDLGARLSAFRGEGLSKTSEETQRLNAALTGGIVPLTQLALSVRAITGDQAVALREQARYTDSIDASQKAVDAMRDHLPPAKDSLTELQTAILNVKVAWDQFIDALSKSPAIQSGVEAAARLLEAAAALFPHESKTPPILDVGTALGGPSSIGTPAPAPGSSFNPLGPGADIIGQGLRLLPGSTETTIYIPVDEIANAISKGFGLLVSAGALATAPGLVRPTGAPGAEDANTTVLKANNDALGKIPEALAKLPEDLQKLITAFEEAAKKTVAAASTAGLVAGGAAGVGASALAAAGQLNPGFNASINNMIAAAAAAGFDIGKGSGYRSSEQQAQLYASDVASHGGMASGLVAPPGHSNHELGLAMDLVSGGGGLLRGGDAAAWVKANAGLFGLTVPMSYEPWHIEPIGARGGLGAGSAPSPAAGGEASGPTALGGGGLSDRALELQKEINAEYERAAKLRTADGLDKQVESARQEMQNRLLTQNISETDRKNLVDAAGAQVLRIASIDRERQTRLYDQETEGKLKSAAASQVSEAAMVREDAEAQFGLEKLQRRSQELRTGSNARTASFEIESDQERRLAEILERGAATAVDADAKKVVALNQHVSAAQRDADATALGAAAAVNATIQNQAEALTHTGMVRAIAAHDEALKSLAAAEESHNDKLKTEAQHVVEVTQRTLDQARAQEVLALAKETEIATSKETTALEQRTNTLKDESAVIDLELLLQGKTTEQISAQVELLKARQDVTNKNVDASKAIEAAEAAGKTGLADELRAKQAQLQTAQQGYVAQVTADGEHKIALADAQRETTRLNDAVRSVADTINSQITTAMDNAFSGQKAVSWGDTMKTILRDLLSQIVQFTLIKPAIGTALTGLGFEQTAQQFGSFGSLGGSSGSGTGALGSLGQLFGLGGSEGTDFTGGGSVAGLLQGPTLSGATLDTVAGSSSGLLGGLFSEGGALSGVGSLFSAISPALPLVGPIAGVLGLVGGLIGNKTPSNNASGANIDLATGAVTGSSGGVAANDSAVKQISDQLAAFTKSVQQLTGGTAAGLISAQVGTRDGTKIDYAGPGGSFSATDVTSIELQIAKNLSGVSDTLKTVLANLTDPTQVQAAVTFAATYDNLKTAADAAFSSISTDTYKIGPFATALANLEKTFGDLTTQANLFGLSLDPINAGLAEATKRLQTDFGTSLDSALNTANAAAFVDQLKTVSQTFATNTQEAQAIGLGGDAGTQAKIAQVEAAQAAAILAPLTADQLQKVITDLGQTNPEISAMAQAILNAGLAATGATTALTNLATGIKSVEDLANSLRSGQLSGLPPAQAAAAAGGSFQQSLAAALAAGTTVTGDQLTNLSSLGTAAIQASQAAYGEGPQTAALRNLILGGLGQVTAITGPSTAAAAAAAATPQSVALGAIGAAPTVQATQIAAVIAALHAAGVPGYALGTGSTVPGAIVVGESGPEIITQPGGLSVTPISAHPGYAWYGNSSGGNSGNDAALLARVDALLSELAALRKQTQGGQVQAMNDAGQQTGYLANLDRKAGIGAVTPMRQRMGR
jgi:hypothetical protein